MVSLMSALIAKLVTDLTSLLLCSLSAKVDLIAMATSIVDHSFIHIYHEIIFPFIFDPAHCGQSVRRILPGHRIGTCPPFPDPAPRYQIEVFSNKPDLDLLPAPAPGHGHAVRHSAFPGGDHRICGGKLLDP